MVDKIQWKHREGAPGYYVRVDGQLQTLLDEGGRFVVCCMAEEIGQGFEVVAGPADSLEELGVPSSMVAEGDDMMMADIAARATRGEKVEISVFAPTDS